MDLQPDNMTSPLVQTLLVMTCTFDPVIERNTWFQMLGHLRPCDPDFRTHFFSPGGRHGRHGPVGASHTQTVQTVDTDADIGACFWAVRPSVRPCGDRGADTAVVCVTARTHNMRLC